MADMAVAGVILYLVCRFGQGARGREGFGVWEDPPPWARMVFGSGRNPSGRSGARWELVSGCAAGLVWFSTGLATYALGAGPGSDVRFVAMTLDIGVLAVAFLVAATVLAGRSGRP